MSLANRLEALLAAEAGDSVSLDPILELDSSSCSTQSRDSFTAMVAENLGVIDPLDFSGFALGRTSGEMHSDLVILNLAEYGWIRRHDRRGQPPPPILVWLPGPSPISPQEAALFELRPLTLRQPR
jgi:hypothetical protein